MKIGILTFHWATNYGAVLQAYALQLFLSKLGYDVKIIDYVPRGYSKEFFKCFITKRPWLIKKYLSEYFKEQKLINFRKAHFNLTKKYNTSNELKIEPPECDIYICGSDQIWNQGFTARGEGKTTLSYFLDFGSVDTIRIAYAVSFGCTEYSEELIHIVTPVLSKFDAISVRDKTGFEIVRNMGFDNVRLMPDPTLLLSAKDYDEILDCTINQNNVFCFFYVIHDRQFAIKKIEGYLLNKLPERIISTREFKYSMMDLTQWLSLIKTAKTIVTNSYHGVVFSIIFKKPFIAVPVEGPASVTNDRIFTLLGQLGLQDRIINNCDPSRISALLSDQIDWDRVGDKIQALRNDAQLFLSKSMRHNLTGENQSSQQELREAQA